VTDTGQDGGPGHQVALGAARLDPAEDDDVIMGCAFPERGRGLNIGRNAWLQAGLPIEVPGSPSPGSARQGCRPVPSPPGHYVGMAEIMFAGGRRSMSRTGGGNKADGRSD